MFEIKQYSRIDGKLKDSYMLHNVDSKLELHTILTSQHGQADNIRLLIDGFSLEYYDKVFIVTS